MRLFGCGHYSHAFLEGFICLRFQIVENSLCCLQSDVLILKDRNYKFYFMYVENIIPSSREKTIYVYI